MWFGDRRPRLRLNCGTLLLPMSCLWLDGAQRERVVELYQVEGTRSGTFHLKSRINL